jgi:membrane-associated protease RseP (regulator of RpoE activity)
MKKHLLGVVGVALVALLPLCHAAAQESAGASGEVTAEANQSDASASGSASASQSQSESSTSGSAQADAQASGSTSNQAGSQSSTESTADSQPATSDGAANPATSAGAATSDNSADNNNANEATPATSAPSSASQSDSAATIPAPQQPRADGDQPATQQEAASRNNQADASVRGQARVGAQAQQRSQEAFQRGVQFGAASNRGLAIAGVEQGSIYYRSGFRRGDVIVALRGRPIRSQADFMRFIVMYPGQRIPVVVLRNGRQETIYVEYPQEIVHTQHIHAHQAGGAYLGVMFNAQVRDAAVVLSVNAGSPAESAGLQAGDTILAMNGQEVRSYPEVISMIRRMRPGQEVDIVLARGQSEMQVFAVLDAQANVRTATRPGHVHVYEPVPADQRIGVDVDVNQGRDSTRLLDRDRNNDGIRDGRLLPRLLD